MLGSGPDDGDIIEMSGRAPGRRWAPRGRGRLVLIAAGACALLAVGATLAAVRLSAGGPSGPALARLITEVTTVPMAPAVSSSPAPPGSAVFNDAGSAAYSSSLSIIFSSTAAKSAPLTADGKPEVLYIATGYCPFCVAENWALIVALSHFGQFSGLNTSRSPAFEGVPPVDGWTFYGSSYASRYLTFVPVETYSNVLVSPKANPGQARSYRKLQPLTPSEQAVLGKLDLTGSTPFLDFGGRAVMLGSNVSPPALTGITWNQIADDLREAKTAAGMTIIAGANALTAEFCRLTGDRPAAACAR